MVLNETDFRNYLENQSYKIYASQIENGQRIVLEYSGNKKFKVTNNCRPVYEGPSMGLAIRFFNNYTK